MAALDLGRQDFHCPAAGNTPLLKHRAPQPAVVRPGVAAWSQLFMRLHRL